MIVDTVTVETGLEADGRVWWRLCGPRNRAAVVESHVFPGVFLVTCNLSVGYSDDLVHALRRAADLVAEMERR